MRISVLVSIVALVAACSGVDPVRIQSPQVDPEIRLSSRYRSIAIQDVSLPTYAALEEISVAGAGGALVPVSGTLWADDPVRAVTLELSRALSRITGATVAPEPWPFRSIPGAVLDVRVETILADPAGTFRIAGQYFVAPDGSPGRERAELFDLSVPYDPATGAAGIPDARARAVAELARIIVRTGLR